MADFFTMPKQGVDMEEGTLVKWLKKEGEPIKKGEMIAEIETDKTTLEVECLCEGLIRKFYHAEGDTVPCGTPLAFIGSETDEIPEVKEAAAAEPEKEEAAAAQENESALENQPEEALVQAVSAGGRIFATPRARKLAAKEGVDLSLVTGTAANGRIVEYDVRKFLASGMPGRKAVRKHQETVIPFRGVRKATAKHMMESLSGMAQAHMSADIDAANLVSMRAQLNKKFEADGKKVSYLDLIIAATARALAEHPDANAVLKDDGIHHRNYANIGVAVNTDNGLFVPVVADADILSPLEIDQKVKTLAAKARDGKLTGAEMSGGTFTVSNLGMYEIDTFTAIINPPETGILAVSRIMDRIVPVNGQPAVRPMMNICLTYDHRLIDGAPAAAFMTTLRHYLENPAWILL